MDIEFKRREYKKRQKNLMRGEIESAIKELKNRQFESYREKLETICERKVAIKARYQKHEEDFELGLRPKQPKTPLTPAQIQKQYRDRLKAEKMSEKAVTDALNSEFKGVDEASLLSRISKNAKNGNVGMVLKLAKFLEIEIERSLKIKLKVTRGTANLGGGAVCSSYL